MTEGDQPTGSTRDELDLAEILQVLWRSKWVIAAAMAALIALAIAYRLQAPPEYEVSTLLAPAEESAGSGGQLPSQLQALAGVSLSSGGNVDEALGTLTSDRFLGNFISDKKLKPKLFPDLTDPETGAWDLEPAQSVPTLNAAVGKLRNRLEISQTDRGLIEVTMRWRDREQAAQWTNELVDRINRVIRKRELERSNNKIAFLQKKMAETNLSSVRQAMIGLMEKLLQEKAVSKTRSDYVFEVIDPAVPPDPGSVTNLPLAAFAVLGAMAGFVVGVLAVFVGRFISINFGRPAWLRRRKGRPTSP